MNRISIKAITIGLSLLIALKVTQTLLSIFVSMNSGWMAEYLSSPSMSIVIIAEYSIIIISGILSCFIGYRIGQLSKPDDLLNATICGVIAVSVPIIAYGIYYPDYILTKLKPIPLFISLLPLAELLLGAYLHKKIEEKKLADHTDSDIENFGTPTE